MIFIAWQSVYIMKRENNFWYDMILRERFNYHLTTCTTSTSSSLYDDNMLVSDTNLPV